MERYAKLIFWLPRILSLAFIAFLSLFALDVFEAYSGVELLLALFMHLIPSFFLLAVVALAWHFELVGAFVFIAGGFAYIWLVGFDRPWSWYALISGPAFLVGILFLLSWLIKRKQEIA